MLFNYLKYIIKCVPDKDIANYLKLSNLQKFKATTKVKDIEEVSDYRQTNLIPLPEELIEYTKNNITFLYDNLLLNTYKKSINFIEGPQFLHYSIGGRYDVHNDCEDFVDGKLKRVIDRDITILVYLNDDYEGGELEFPDWGIKFKPKSGSVIIFPSYSEFSHCVNPVTKGERFNLVAWICTNDRIYPRPYK